MTATIYSICPQCGWVHEMTADRLACDARHGRRWPAEIRYPLVSCALCGATGQLDEILDHMQYVESHRDVTSGRLIRYVEDVPGL